MDSAQDRLDQIIAKALKAKADARSPYHDHAHVIDRLLREGFKKGEIHIILRDDFGIKKARSWFYEFMKIKESKEAARINCHQQLAAAGKLVHERLSNSVHQKQNVTTSGFGGDSMGAVAVKSVSGNASGQNIQSPMNFMLNHNAELASLDLDGVISQHQPHITSCINQLFEAQEAMVVERRARMASQVELKGNETRLLRLEAHQKLRAAKDGPIGQQLIAVASIMDSEDKKNKNIQKPWKTKYIADDATPIFARIINERGKEVRRALYEINKKLREDGKFLNSEGQVVEQI